MSLADALPKSMVDEKGRTLHLEVNQTNGYFNATLMCKSAGKKWNDYYRNQGTGSFLKCLSVSAGISAIELIFQPGGGNNQRHTWVHRKVAIHLAQWISPSFAVWVSDLVEMFLTNQLAPTESIKTIESLNNIIQAVQGVLDVVEWNGKREVAKQLTKAKSSKIHQLTGGKAKAAYWVVNQALTKSVAGKTPGELKAEHKWSKGDTPRNYMPVGMLSLLNLGEDRVDHELEKACKEAGRFLTDREVQAIAMRITVKMFELCSSTGGFDVPLLKETPGTQKRRATGNMLAPAKQQKLIACH